MNDVVKLQADLAVGLDLPIESRTASLAGSPRALPTAAELADACLHITVGTISTPPVFAQATPEVNPFSVDLEVDFWNGAPRSDIPLDVGLYDKTDPLSATGKLVDRKEVSDGHFRTKVDPDPAFPVVNLELVVNFADAADPATGLRTEGGQDDLRSRPPEDRPSGSPHDRPDLRRHRQPCPHG